jgi:hypothetical protein
MHEVVAAATSSAGAGAVTLPAPSNRPGSRVVPAYPSRALPTGIGLTGGVRAVS